MVETCTKCGKERTGTHPRWCLDCRRGARGNARGNAGNVTVVTPGNGGNVTGTTVQRAVTDGNVTGTTEQRAVTDGNVTVVTPGNVTEDGNAVVTPAPRLRGAAIERRYIMEGIEEVGGGSAV